MSTEYDNANRGVPGGYSNPNPAYPEKEVGYEQPKYGNEKVYDTKSYAPATVTTAPHVPAYQHSGMNRPYITSPVAMILTALQAVTFSAWFVIQLATHSVDDQNSLLIQLALQSQQLFTHGGIIVLGTLTALLFADIVKTRAARVMSAFVQMFGTMAGLWNLFFIIPAFKDSSDPQNQFCTVSTTGNGTLDSKWCELARATAALACAQIFFSLIIAIYSVINCFLLPIADDGTPKEVMEVDDAEIDAFVAADPNQYGAADTAEKASGVAILGLNLLTLAGYGVIMYAGIEMARKYAFTFSYGDAILSDMLRQLSLSLVVAIAISTYSALRRNRVITGAALFLVVLAMFQWWSFFIEACRRFGQQSDYPDAATPLLTQTDWHTQKAIVAGSGAIAGSLTITALGLVMRYFSYVPIQKTHLTPSYQQGVFAYMSPVFVCLFLAQAIATTFWFVLQFTLQSNRGLFNDDPAVSSMVVTERLFIYQCMFFAAAYLSAGYAEKQKNIGSWWSSFLVNVVIMCGWLLLVFPWTYNAVYRDGLILAGGAPAAYTPALNSVNFTGFCSANYSQFYCRIVQAAAVLSCITGGLYFLLAVYQICKISLFAADPDDGTAVVNADGTMVAQMGLPPVALKNHVVGLLTTLSLAGLLVWALASIYTITTQAGVDAYVSYSNIPVPVNSGSSVQCDTTGTNDDFDCGTQNSFYSYLYGVAYPIIVVLAFASWIGGEVSQNAYKSNWVAFRSLLFGTTAMCFDFLAPLLIFTARTVNSASLNSANLAISAGVFILTGATLLWLCSSIWHYFSLPIPVPDRTVTVMTKDLQLNSVAVDPVNKAGEAARAAAIGSGNMYSAAEAGYPANNYPTDTYPASTYPATTAATTHSEGSLSGRHREYNTVEIH